MTARYFFDVTDIKAYLNTHVTLSGIQRVSVEVIQAFLRQLGPERVYLCLWEGRRGTYSVIATHELARGDGIDIDVLNALLTGRTTRPAESVPTVLQRYRNRPIKYHIYRLVADLQALRGKESYFAKRGSSIAEWRARPKGGSRTHVPAAERRPVADLIGPEDHLIVLGATWGMSGFDAHLRQLKESRGVQITLQVHDLIPLMRPEHLVSAFSLEFYRWLEQAAGYATRFVVAAENTKRDLERFLGEIEHDLPISVIPFARQLDTSAGLAEGESLKEQARALHRVAQDIRNKTKVPYVLVVGTLESRKNLWRLVQAWDRLTREPDLEMPRLILAGRQGWFNEDLMAWMRTSGNLRGWVQFVEGPSDAELAFLYRHCLFTATVSLYEGWGLPIGESLSFGKTAVVADNSAMPEVGGDLVEYCDANSITSIAQACRRLVAEPDHRRALEEKIARADLRDWDAVATDYIATLEAPSGR